MFAEDPHGAAGSDADEHDSDEEKNESQLNVELSMLDSQESRYFIELREVAEMTRRAGERLDQLQARVRDADNELGSLQRPQGGGRVDDDKEVHHEVSTLKEITTIVTAGFRNAVASQLGDPTVVAQLSGRNGRTTSVMCRVHWGQEHADWKVLDTEVGTELTFEALLHVRGPCAAPAQPRPTPEGPLGGLPHRAL